MQEWNTVYPEARLVNGEDHRRIGIAGGRNTTQGKDHPRGDHGRQSGLLQQQGEKAVACGHAVADHVLRGPDYRGEGSPIHSCSTQGGSGSPHRYVHRGSERQLHFDSKFEHEEMVLVA